MSRLAIALLDWRPSFVNLENPVRTLDLRTSWAPRRNSKRPLHHPPKSLHYPPHHPFGSGWHFGGGHNNHKQEPFKEPLTLKKLNNLLLCVHFVNYRYVAKLDHTRCAIFNRINSGAGSRSGLRRSWPPLIFFLFCTVEEYYGTTQYQSGSFSSINVISTQFLLVVHLCIWVSLYLLLSERVWYWKEDFWQASCDVVAFQDICIVSWHVCQSDLVDAISEAWQWF